MVYRNPQTVSRFYAADRLSPTALAPLDYEVISPVEYKVAGHDKRYTIFVPPNLDSSDWLLDGKEAAPNVYAAWKNGGGKVEYSRFKVYEASYIISISSAIAVAAVCLVLWKKEFLWRIFSQLKFRLSALMSSHNRGSE
jgi:hypothetical protein